MVFDLILDVMNGFWQLGDAHAESAVTLLPTEDSLHPIQSRDPFNRPAGTGLIFLLTPGTSYLALSSCPPDKRHSPLERLRLS